MSMILEVAEQLEKAGAPTHIHGMNLIRLRQAHAMSPSGASSPSASPLMLRLSAQLAEAMQQPPGGAASVAQEGAPGKKPATKAKTEKAGRAAVAAA